MLREIFCRVSFSLVVLWATYPQSVIAQQSAVVEGIPNIVHNAWPSMVTITMRDETGRVLATGSGFVVASEGLVLTNAHVVQLNGVAEVEARFQDGSSFQVQGIAALDSDHDLALIKLKSVNHEFPALRLGNSGIAEAGQHVIAIGSPLAGASNVSTDSTVSDGIVSGLRDWPNGKMKVFQVTTPISPGSSGGALLNMSGEAIGVTSAGIPDGQNLNFAVPISYAAPLLTKLDGHLKSFAEAAASALPESTNAPAREQSVSGSYTGVWQSGRFSATGAATLTIKVSPQDGSVTASIFLTGGEVTSASLSGMGHKTGENIWTVEMSSKRPKLHVRGIFRGGSFVGDYAYSRFALADHGQWILKKE
jgi:S1-C subfamily serine protease